MCRRSPICSAILVFALALAPTGALPAQSPSSFQKSNPQLLAALAEAVAKPSQFTVRVRNGDKDAALGAIVKPDGWIVTKASELKGEVMCKLKDNREFPAKLVGVQKDYDLAMLKIDAKDLPAAEWRRSTDVDVGSWIVTPGLGKEPVAVGVLSVAKRNMPPGPRVLPNPNGGFLGITMEDTEEGGVKVVEVREKSPAETAGVKVGDVILAINKKEIRDRESMLETLGKYKAGDEVTVKLYRDGKELELKATLIRRPPNIDRGGFQNAMGSMLSERRTGFPVVLQHDTVLKPSDCGGPAVDLDGKVIGINIARAGRTESYAIPSEVVQSLIPDLIAGKFPPPVLPKALSAAEQRLRTAEAVRTRALADKAAAEKQIKDADDAIRKAKADIEAERKKEDDKAKDEKKPDAKDKKE